MSTLRDLAFGCRRLTPPGVFLRGATLLFVLACGATAHAAVVGSPCDPNQRDPGIQDTNLCIGRNKCRRLGPPGSCVHMQNGMRVNDDRKCLDNPDIGHVTATAFTTANCSLCTGVTGQCEELDGCNSDSDCMVLNHSCIEGVCQFVPPTPVPAPTAAPPECTKSEQCRAAHDGLWSCVDQKCTKTLTSACECTTSADCGSFAACAFGLCAKSTHRCDVDEQCGGLRCVAGDCLGQRPPDGRVTAPECSATRGCRDGFRCTDNGKCIPDVKPFKPNQ
jgi:hypothetical protein